MVVLAQNEYIPTFIRKVNKLQYAREQFDETKVVSSVCAQGLIQISFGAEFYALRVNSDGHSGDKLK